MPTFISSPLLLYEYSKSTLILHYMSMAMPTLISTLLLWVRQVYAHRSLYEFGDAYAQLYSVIIIRVRKVYAHLTLHESGKAFVHLTRYAKSRSPLVTTYFYMFIDMIYLIFSLVMGPLLFHDDKFSFPPPRTRLYMLFVIFIFSGDSALCVGCVCVCVGGVGGCVVVCVCLCVCLFVCFFTFLVLGPFL